jgi:hypothetical protein
LWKWEDGEGRGDGDDSVESAKVGRKVAIAFLGLEHEFG